MKDKSNLDETEVDLRLHFEEVTNKNLKAVIEYTQKSREIILAHGEEIKRLENLIKMQQADIANLRTQMSGMLQKLYAGGS